MRQRIYAAIVFGVSSALTVAAIRIILGADKASIIEGFSAALAFGGVGHFYGSARK